MVTAPHTDSANLLWTQFYIPTAFLQTDSCVPNSGHIATVKS